MTLRVIAGKFKGRLLKTPKGSKTRPTQGMLRESVFNICQSVISEARFLDLFAGSGAMGIEALSRGASHATFIEKDRRALSCIRENLAMLEDSSQTTIYPLDAKTALSRLLEPYEIIYADPPYDTPLAPYIDEILERNLLAPGAFLFLEERFRKNAPSLEFDGLEAGKPRHFGDAALHQYRFSGK